MLIVLERTVGLGGRQCFGLFGVDVLDGNVFVEVAMAFGFNVTCCDDFT